MPENRNIIIGLVVVLAVVLVILYSRSEAFAQKDDKSVVDTIMAAPVVAVNTVADALAGALKPFQTRRRVNNMMVQDQDGQLWASPLSGVNSQYRSAPIPASRVPVTVNIPVAGQRVPVRRFPGRTFQGDLM